MVKADAAIDAKALDEIAKNMASAPSVLDTEADADEMYDRLFVVTANLEWFRLILLGKPTDRPSEDVELDAYARRICDAMNKAVTLRDYANAMRLAIDPLHTVLQSIKKKEEV
jgi:hypothetical protein